jgi:hypothetical protein
VHTVFKHIVTISVSVWLIDKFWVGRSDLLHLIHSHRQYSAIAVLHTFHCCTHLGFSVFTTRIMTTDLSQSHCNFKSHVKSSWHSLILFFPFLLNHLGLPSPELDPVLPTAVLNYVLLCFYYCFILRDFFWQYPLITPQHKPHGKHIICRQECMFTCPLPRNRHPIVGRVTPLECVHWPVV